MRLTIPMKHQIEVLLSKKRRSNYTNGVVNVDVNILEVPENEVRLLHKIKSGNWLPSPRHRERYSPFLLEQGETKRICMHEGSYYIEILKTSDIDAISVDCSMRNPFNVYYTDVIASAFNPSDQSDRTDCGELDVYDGQADYEQDLGVKVKTWTSFADDVVNEVRRRAECMLVIGDALYEKIGEPCLALSRDANGNILSLSEASEIDRGFRFPHVFGGISSRFGLDEYDLAMNYFEQNCKDSVDSLVPSMEITECSSSDVNFRGANGIIFREIGSLLNNVDGLLSQLDSDALRHWHSLHKGYVASDTLTRQLLNSAYEFCNVEQLTRPMCDNFVRRTAEDQLVGLRRALQLREETDTNDRDWIDQALTVPPAFSRNYRVLELATHHSVYDHASRLGADVGEWIEMAKCGVGSILRVDTPDGSYGLCYVISDGGETIISDTVSRDGRFDTDEVQNLVSTYYAEACRFREDIEAVDHLATAYGI